MPSLKEVRNRIQSVRSTQQITKAMKMVSAAKLRRAQDNIVALRPYAGTLANILQNLTTNLPKEDIESPYLQVRPIEKVLIICITSDRGLCGAFNGNVMKNALAVVEEKYGNLHQNGQVTFLPIGSKGYDFLRRRSLPIVGDFVQTFQNLSFAKVKQAADFILEAFKLRSFDKVEVIYNEFKNVATQVVRIEPFLPLEQTVAEVKKDKNNTDYILEPSQEEIIQELIPKSLRIQLYKAVLESNASEHGARMTAMDKATENAGELIKELQLMYNRTRQAAITKEILEIVGGAEALKGA
ncbi:MAG TPA: ATP synthase F1 subunit gamma [Microscillaceae bacterium]|nr:ATP synthase F1 subunit gamma [Microscillaceae bacterium]